MGLISLVKELLMAFFFVCSVQFWRMALLWSFSVLFSYYRLFKASLSQWLVFKPVILDKCPFFSQKLVSYPRCYPFTSNFRPVCVVTGATSGLGLAAAYKLSKEGYVVAIVVNAVGRSQQLLSETIRKIKDSNEDAHLKAFQVDMSSIESIIKFKVSLRQWLLDSDLHCSLQLLINNAGILATSPRVTAEGYDQGNTSYIYPSNTVLDGGATPFLLYLFFSSKFVWMIGTNYIGAFALTKLLLPLLESSPVSSKIVNVTSFTHRAGTPPTALPNGKISPDICQDEIYWVIGVNFGLLAFIFCIVGISVADPGVVQTNLMREVPTILSSLALRVLKFLQLLQFPESGVDSIIDAALAPPGTSGAYYFGGKGRTINPSALSHNAKLARELWESTSKLLSVTPFGAEGNSCLLKRAGGRLDLGMTFESVFQMQRNMLQEGLILPNEELTKEHLSPYNVLKQELLEEAVIPYEELVYDSFGEKRCPPKAILTSIPPLEKTFNKRYLIIDTSTSYNILLG
ncbi:hypothetical protein V8G54_007820 [Vigna mungo]|uniref:Uncharacterized protein n=1 Tax=Vigna mungo TaxID=3915 RepID=A0AAQ3P647_VIGMU